MTKRDYGSGSVSKMKNGKWTARLFLGVDSEGKRQIKAFYGDKRAEAKKKMIEDQRNEESLVNEKISKLFLDDLMGQWLTDVKSKRLKPKSYDRLKQTIDLHVIPYIGKYQVVTITGKHIELFLNTLKGKGYSYSTVKICGLIYSIFRRNTKY